MISENVKKFQEMRTEPKEIIMPEGPDQDILNNIERSKAMMRQHAQAQIDKMKATGPTANENQLGMDLSDTPTAQSSGQLSPEAQQRVFGGKGVVTQQFGNYNPEIEVFSDGINTGTDFGMKEGTKLALPKGKWKVMESFNRALKKGKIGDSTNRGYGNSVLVRNVETGEELRFSHLSQVGVRQGQQLQGGVVFATTGSTGNSTAPHLDLEYRDARGKLGDILKSKYSSYLL